MINRLNFRQPQVPRWLWALRILLGATFIAAGASKVLSPKDFSYIIANYQILPFYLVKPAALFLPWLELTAGFCLFMGCFRRGSLMIIDILMIIFILAILTVIVRGIDVACGCFSLSLTAREGAYSYLLRDLLILAVAICLSVFEFKKPEGPAEKFSVD
jgi:uncharacterized membrane protein YphA (DoxX/SURF4 family)